MSDAAIPTAEAIREPAMLTTNTPDMRTVSLLSPGKSPYMKVDIPVKAHIVVRNARTAM